MIDGLRPYPAYKDCRVPSLGEMPEHWKVRPLRQVAQMLVSNVDKHTHEYEKPVRLCNYVDVYKSDRITERIGFMQASATPAEIERFRLRKADVAITKDSETWNDIGVPALVECEAPDLVYGYHLAVLRPHAETLHGAYLFRAFQSQGVATQLHVRANGVTRFGLSHNAIKAVLAPIPLLPEQTGIVRFLDWADRRIRRVIRARQRRITLLEEYKQVLIHRAVTGQIDVRTGQPYPAYKPSDVEWLGEVPEHWAVSSVKRLARDGRKTFTDGDWIELPYITDHGVRLIQTGNVGSGEYREKGFRFVSEETFDQLRCTEVRPNDVLICRLDGPVGRACLAPDLGYKAITSVDNTILKTRTDVDSRYVVYVLSSPNWLDWIHSICRAGGGFRYRVSRSMLGDARLPKPPLAEQRAIVDALGASLEAARKSIVCVETTIARLREYRTRLIMDVVTGKIDVREAAASLPEEPEADELERVDEKEAAEAEEGTGETDLEAESEEAAP